MPASKEDALAQFLATADGKKLLEGFRRVVDILSAEQEKDGRRAYSHRHAPNLRIEHQEHKLAAAIARGREETAEKLEKKDYAGALRAAAKLQAPLDAFFDHTAHDVDNPSLRLNRLRLLAEVRRVIAGVADFDNVSGATGGGA